MRPKKRTGVSVVIDTTAGLAAARTVTKSGKPDTVAETAAVCEGVAVRVTIVHPDAPIISEASSSSTTL
jgi:hypothetical protein